MNGTHKNMDQKGIDKRSLLCKIILIKVLTYLSEEINKGHIKVTIMLHKIADLAERK